MSRERARTFDADERLRHGCADLDTDDEGWMVIVCDCGLNLGQFPDSASAVDALIDHVLIRSLA